MEGDARDRQNRATGGDDPRGPSVGRVAQERRAHVRRVNADLMGSTGLRFDREQRGARCRRNDGKRGLCVRRIATPDATLSRIAIATDRERPSPPARLGHPSTQSDVVTRVAPQFAHARQVHARLVTFGEEHHPAHADVETRRRVEPVDTEQPAHLVLERARRAAVIGDGRHARRFVGRDDARFSRQHVRRFALQRARGVDNDLIPARDAIASIARSLSADKNATLGQRSSALVTESRQKFAQ